MKKQEEKTSAAVPVLKEWNSVKDVCAFFGCSRSFFNNKLKKHLEGRKWSTHLLRYHKDEIQRLSDYLRDGGAV